MWRWTSAGAGRRVTEPRISGTDACNMYLPAHTPPFQPLVPYDALPPLPPPANVTESVPVLRREADARQALTELKGVANIGRLQMSRAERSWCP